MDKSASLKGINELNFSTTIQLVPCENFKAWLPECKMARVSHGTVIILDTYLNYSLGQIYRVLLSW